MIITARQLEQIYKSTGQVRLPGGARLTPLAQDWIRQQKIAVSYTDGESTEAIASSLPNVGRKERPTAPPLDPIPVRSGVTPREPIVRARWMWWSDSPCGPAKAALAMVAREVGLETIEIPADSKHLPDALKALATELKAGNVDGGILLVGNGATAMLCANRCPLLRAVLGTCLESVEQGVRLAAANVLVIEHPTKSLPQIKTLLARFVRGKRELNAEMQRVLKELSECE